jgi:hypothetical protein
MSYSSRQSGGCNKSPTQSEVNSVHQMSFIVQNVHPSRRIINNSIVATLAGWIRWLIGLSGIVKSYRRTIRR